MRIYPLPDANRAVRREAAIYSSHLDLIRDFGELDLVWFSAEKPRAKTCRIELKDFDEKHRHIVRQC